MTEAHKEDPMLTLSYSEAATYSRCPRKYQHRAIDKIQKVGYFRPAMYRGSHFHELMKRWNLDEDFMAYHWATVSAIEQDEERFVEMREERLEALDLALSLFERYIDNYDDMGDHEILNVEEEFVFEMEGKQFTTTPDLVYRDASGQIWVRDYKTMASLPEEFPFGDLQPVFTVTAVAAAYDEPVNFEYHCIRAKLPTEPRLNKTGPPKVNNLNRIDTTFKILRDFLSETAPQLLTDKEHKTRLAELRDEDRFFKVLRHYGTPDQLERNLELMRFHARSIERCHVAGEFPQHPLHTGLDSCGSCEFRLLCEGEWHGYDLKAILRDSYEARDIKNPYTEDLHDDAE